MAKPKLKASPFVKWAGGKGQLLVQLQPYFPDTFQRYIEPFLGGGALFFHLQPKRAVLGDSNPELMEAYQVVRDQVEELMADLHRHASRTLDKEYYYQLRAVDPARLDPVARTARFIYLNKTCYNGLYRVNRRGRFNVPFGSYKRAPALYDAETLRNASLLLQGTDLRHTDFQEVMAAGRPGRLHLPGPSLRPPLGHGQLHRLHRGPLRAGGAGATGRGHPGG